MREIGLVVPASFVAYTKSKKDAITLDKEMVKRKEMFSTLDVKHKQKRFYRRFPIYDVWRGGGGLIGGGAQWVQAGLRPKSKRTIGLQFVYFHEV